MTENLQMYLILKMKLLIKTFISAIILHEKDTNTYQGDIKHIKKQRTEFFIAFSIMANLFTFQYLL